MREQRTTGRPRGFDLDATLEVLMRLFWARGFEGVSLADLAEATGLRKGSLYAAYGDKRAMYLGALARYEAVAVDAAVAGRGGAGAPMERLRAFLSAPIEAASVRGDRRGCFLCNASADRAALDPEAARLVRRGFDKLEAALVCALGEIRPGRDEAGRRERARLILAVYAGLYTMGRSGLDRARLEAARDAALVGV